MQSIDLQIIVRGAPVLNDATMEDALQIGLDKIANVTSNGSNVAGTCIDKISGPYLQYFTCGIGYSY